MESLVLVTNKDINFYVKGSTLESGIVTLEIKNDSIAGRGNSMSINYVYTGIYSKDGVPTRVKIDTDAFPLNQEEMDSLYEQVKPGIPEGATFSQMMSYLNSTVGKAEFLAKFLPINPGFTSEDIDIANQL